MWTVLERQVDVRRHGKRIQRAGRLERLPVEALLAGLLLPVEPQVRALVDAGAADDLLDVRNRLLLHRLGRLEELPRSRQVLRRLGVLRVVALPDLARRGLRQLEIR